MFRIHAYLSSLYQFSNVGKKMRADRMTCFGSSPYIYCPKEIVKLDP